MLRNFRIFPQNYTNKSYKNSAQNSQYIFTPFIIPKSLDMYKYKYIYDDSFNDYEFNNEKRYQDKIQKLEELVFYYKSKCDSYEKILSKTK
jgi:hypothetical protein